MAIERLNMVGAATMRPKMRQPMPEAGSFQQQLQSSAEPEGTSTAPRGISPFGADVQTVLAGAAVSKSGAPSFTRAYDPALDEAAMTRLAALDMPHMPPEQYWNYIQSDQPKYDGLITAARLPADSIDARIFAGDPATDSKIQMIRDFNGRGEPLPLNMAEFDQAWLGDAVRQKALALELKKLAEAATPNG